MKLQTNSESFSIWKDNFIVSNQIITRDYKTFPFNKAAYDSTYNNVLNHYKNKVLFNPNISFPDWTTNKYSYFNSFILNGEKYLKHINFYSQATNAYKYSDDFESLEKSTTVYPPANLQDITENYFYGTSSYYSTTNTSYVPTISGFLIRSKDKISYFIDIKSCNNSSSYLTNCFEWRILDSNEERDLVILDLNFGSGSTTTSTSYSGSLITSSNFGYSARMNEVKVFTVPVSGNGTVFQKNVNSTDWYKATSTTASSSYTFYSKPSNCIKNEDGTYTTYLVRMVDTTKVGIWKIIINEEEAVYTTFYQTLDTDLPFELAPVNTTSLGKVSRYYISEQYKKEGKLYLSIIISNVTSDIKSGVYTYEINEEENTATFKGEYHSYNNFLMNYYMINETTMLISSPQGYEILSLNLDSGVWSKTASKQISLNAIVYDDVANSLFYVDTSKNLYMDKLNLAMTSDWGWTETDLKWEGTNINTTLYMTCRDYENKIVSQKVSLYIDGNALFTNNNEKEITIQTSSDDQTLIPITITGDGVISVSAKSEVV